MASWTSDKRTAYLCGMDSQECQPKITKATRDCDYLGWLYRERHGR